MNLQFVTSVSQGYWNSVGKHCISTWQLPGEVIVYIDQQEGEIDWFDEIPYHKRLVRVPGLKSNAEISEEDDSVTIQTKTKVRKFWGKACAQIHAVKHKKENTRVIWLDADVEQVSQIPRSLFTWGFKNPVAMMKSNTWSEDCWETGIVIFNHQYPKLDMFIRQYESFWYDPEAMSSIYRPYDAMVLGKVVETKKGGFFNLCKRQCENGDAMQNTIFKNRFKHWINKANKAKLMELKNENR